MASSLPPDPYLVLGIARDADIATIRRAHRKLVLQCHPDRIINEAERAQKTNQFQQVQLAYELLIDEDRRERYEQQVKLAELREKFLKEHQSTPTPRERKRWEREEKRWGEDDWRREKHRERTGAFSIYEDDELRTAYPPKTRLREKPSDGSATSTKWQVRDEDRWTPPARVSVREDTHSDIPRSSPTDSYDTYKRWNHLRDGSSQEYRSDAARGRPFESPKTRPTQENDPPTGKTKTQKTFDRRQLRALERAFKGGKLGSSTAISQIAKEVGLRPDDVHRWYRQQSNSLFRARVTGPRDEDVLHRSESVRHKEEAKKPPRPGGDTIEGLEGLMNGVSVCALADTGADVNFVAQSIAEDLKLDLNYYPPDQCPAFIMGHGREVKACAYATVAWQFKKEPGKTYNLVFYVLRDCIFDVMIGGMFLYATGTMTNHRDRLSRIPRPRSVLHTRVVNLCGTPSRTLNGILESEDCSALPDSGAEPNILAYEYVKKRGWLLNMFPGPESYRLLQFADGSTERTEGRLRLQWTFGQGWNVAGPDSKVTVTFDVLRGCPFDIIFGQEFLDETQAFTKHVDSFQEVYRDQPSGINLVIWARGFSLSALKSRRERRETRQDPHSEPKPDDIVNEELERRAEADRRIERIRNDPAWKSFEQDKEKERRRQWDWDHPGRWPYGGQASTSNSGSSMPGTSSDRSTSSSPPPERTMPESLPSTSVDHFPPPRAPNISQNAPSSATSARGPFLKYPPRTADDTFPPSGSTQSSLPLRGPSLQWLGSQAHALPRDNGSWNVTDKISPPPLRYMASVEEGPREAFAIREIPSLVPPT